LTPAAYPSVKVFDFKRSSSFLEAYKSAVPPPDTIPYEIAALVAHRASVTLSLISPTST
jgi:hypothetical protein